MKRPTLRALYAHLKTPCGSEHLTRRFDDPREGCGPAPELQEYRPSYGYRQDFLFYDHEEITGLSWQDWQDCVQGIRPCAAHCCYALMAQ